MRPAGAVGQSHTKLTERTASKLHLLHSLRLTRLQALCLAQLLSLWGCSAYRQASCLAQLLSRLGCLACKQALILAQLSCLWGCPACKQALCLAQLWSLSGCSACKQALCLAQLWSLSGCSACKQVLCLAQLLSLWGCLAHRGGRRCLQQHMILQAATCSSLALEITYLARSSWQVAAGMQHQ